MHLAESSDEIKKEKNRLQSDKRLNCLPLTIVYFVRNFHRNMELRRGHLDLAIYVKVIDEKCESHSNKINEEKYVRGDA